MQLDSTAEACPRVCITHGFPPFIASTAVLPNLFPRPTKAKQDWAGGFAGTAIKISEKNTPLNTLHSSLHHSSEKADGKSRVAEDFHNAGPYDKPQVVRCRMGSNGGCA
jgi:hypothetical protein